MNPASGREGQRPIAWAAAAAAQQQHSSALCSSSLGSSSLSSTASASGGSPVKPVSGGLRAALASSGQQARQAGPSMLSSDQASLSSSSLSSGSPRRISNEFNWQPQAFSSLASTGSTGSASSSSAGNMQRAGSAGKQQPEPPASSQQLSELENEERQQEENRKLRLQLYVFVLRCISYSFNAKPMNTSELHHKQQQTKLKKQQLEQIIQFHTKFIKSAPSSKQCPHQHLINKSLSQQQLRQLDELYLKVHLSFNRKYLQNERMRILVESESCSQLDLRELFKQNADRILKQSGLFSPPAAYGSFGRAGSGSAANMAEFSKSNLQANKELVLNSWLKKFESVVRGQEGGEQGQQQAAGELQAPSQQQLSKEQLYQMFQNILNIKKFEHQLLYNALQLDSSDEQAAAIRRELDGRIARIAELERNKKLLPKFVLKEMESLYLEEARMSVNKLMVNLDSLPLLKGAGGPHLGAGGGGVGGAGGAGSGANSAGESRGYGLQKFRRYNNRAQASLARDGLVESHPSEPTVTRMDVVLSFNIEVIVMEVRGLRHLAPTREIYCTMEIEGSERLQTEHVQAKKPLWDTQGDFKTNYPLPVLKIKLYAVNPSMLSLKEDKELGRLILRPTVLSPKTPEWCTMTPASSALANSSSSGGQSSQAGHQNQELKIRVVVRMDRPQQLKHCGYLYGVGKNAWRKLKRRYHILIQVSQYTFVMCSYKDKKSKPTEMLQLEGYTVDYIEPPTELIMEHCSEMSAQELHGSGSPHSSSTPFGLAGRLANVILKQPVGGGSSGAGNHLQEAGDNHGPNSASENQENQQEEQPSAIATAAALSDELHSKFYFNVVKEGDSVVFACDDEQECFGWVMALYRATGQAHKPTPLRNQYSGGNSHYIDAAFAYQTSASQPTKLVGNSVCAMAPLSNGSNSAKLAAAAGSSKKSVVEVADQRARKHGMDEFISADPCKFQHNHLFQYLQNKTLNFRLDDNFCSLGWLSPGQILVLDEYCARYGVRTCFRHLAYLNSLLEFNQRGYFIDYTLLNYGYDFCASHVSGNAGQPHPISSVNFDLRPDGVGTVTVEERDLFNSIKAKLLKMIERQISNFFYCFPFGKPDGALKTALSLLERLLMKEQQSCNSMLHNEELRQLLRKCLEQAALNNYTKLSGQANLLSCSPEESGLQQLGANNSSGSELLETPPPSSSERQRTHSNMSSASIGSYASSTASSLEARTQSDSPGSGSFNFNFRRSIGRAQAQQQEEACSSGLLASSEQQHSQNSGKCLTMAMIINSEHIRPREKLRHLVRLAELCCEQVEESQEQFSEAFAWHSDLMLDHYELFWSLFSVDMDKILIELGSPPQPPGSGGLQQVDQLLSSVAPSSLGSLSAGGRSMVSSSVVAATSAGISSTQLACPTSSGAGNQQAESLLQGPNSHRETFTLFQVLNNHLRRRASSGFECKKFKTYLCDTFKSKLLRYIDLTEASMSRLLSKACEKEGQVNCQNLELMFNQLEELQRFIIYQLRWPEEQLAEQVQQRLKLIAFELCEATCQRTLQAFQANERKLNKWTSSTTSYVAPLEMIQMINLVLETRNRSLKVCTFNNLDQMSYHAKIDKLVEAAMGEMQPGLMAKMINALESTLTKLARHDEGKLLAPILTLTYKQGMSSSGKDIGKQYVSFVSNCCDLIRNKINDELWILNLFEEWYAIQMNIICNWLSERIDHSLHDVQLVALSNIMPKIQADMSLQGLPEEKLNLKSYQTIMSRLRMEEASGQLGGSSNQAEQPATGSLFASSILSSLTSSSTGSARSSNNPANNSAAATLSPNSTNLAQSSGSAQTVAGMSGPSPLLQRQQPLESSPAGSFSNGHTSNRWLPPQPPASFSGQLVNQELPAASGQRNGNKQQPQQQSQPQEADNIADRALQSATRMFKGFWAS